MTHLFLDIEALGLTAGSAIIQIGAVALCPETGKTGEQFHRHILPDPRMSVDLATLDWHRKQGTFPLVPLLEREAVAMAEALTDFHKWVTDFGDVTVFWSWGSTYDFPLLDAAWALIDQDPPWFYWQTRCARTVWKLAFGEAPKQAPRPHHALEDAIAGARDLFSALAKLGLVETEVAHG